MDTQIYQRTQHMQQRKPVPPQRSAPPRTQPPRQYKASPPRKPVSKKPQGKQSKPKRRNWLPYAIVGGTLMVMAFFATLLFGGLGLMIAMQERIPTGVSVASVDVGGATIDRAETALEETFSYATVTLTDGGRTWNIPTWRIGAVVDLEATLNAAANAPANATINPVYTVDLEQAQFGFAEMAEDINIEATAERVGRAMEIPVMLDRLRMDASGELGDGIFELNMIEVEPPALIPSGDNEGTTTHVVEAGQELALIAYQYGVTMQEIADLNGISNLDFIYPGQELTIPAAGIYVPSDDEAPAPTTNSGKAIVVDNSVQRIYAYENGELVRTQIVSTGRAETPTVLGDYSVYVKYAADDMSGPGYYLPQVPWTMYFYQGYAIHGTYWHNSFGRPMSHGCVNLPVEEAQWFFEWAEVGTPVRVIA